MTIKDLGRWESLEMVQRYTRSVTFQDSLKFYKAPLSQRGSCVMLLSITLASTLIPPTHTYSRKHKKQQEAFHNG